jgi:hypothetical protein
MPHPNTERTEIKNKPNINDNEQNKDSKLLTNNVKEAAQESVDSISAEAKKKYNSNDLHI